MCYMLISLYLVPMLTLHLHLIAWIHNALSLQEIHDRLIGEDSEFQKQLFAYLEAAHTGDYLTDTSLDVMQFRQKEMMKLTYEDPTEILPQSPPPQCIYDADNCTQLDTLVNIVNVHSCHENTYPDGTLKKNATSKGCKDNKWGKCRGQFPYPLHSETCVEPEIGHVNLKKYTSIKAVLIYVSDYIIKPALKIHVFFDVIKGIF
ncbi:hypothetical protein ARMGADRAFT_1046891 [Armillaria gallica]|uniref:Helitron helicase-like domain-containing protein n=1 Tax=Armillaria gallica TaxID=47427 RepID=A0A2H3DMZ8_ARMGA|nr:hypothetical protein ARMGADRAFT_1046891 [Armillaria gallica]